VAERVGKLPPGAMLVVRALPGAAFVGYRQMAIDLDLALEAATRQRSPR
jgi:hypothetical protein